MREKSVRGALFILCAVLLLSLLFSCGAVSGGGDGEQRRGLIYDSDTELTIITSPDYNSETVMLLWNRIALLADITPDLLTDTSPVREHEIVLGRTGRPISQRAYEELEKASCPEGEYRYLIYSDGSSVAIAFDDDGYGYTLRCAIERFISEYVREELVMNEGVALCMSFAAADENEARAGAGFDDLKNGYIPSKNSGTVISNGYDVCCEKSADTTGVIVIDDPTDESNKVLKYYTQTSRYPEGVKIGMASTVGEWVVFSLDFLVENATGSNPVTFNLGAYGITFETYGECFKIYDVNAYSQKGYLDSFLRFSKWNNLKVIVTNDKSSDKAARAFVFLNGECIAESYNVSGGAFFDYAYLSSGSNDGLVLYYDNIAFYRTSVGDSEESAFAPSRVFTERVTASEDAYQNADMILDEESAAALREMDAGLFSEDIYRWIADLYDPQTSALYFSISGRDNYGYLPDIETVAQGYGILSTLGIGGASTVLNDSQKASLLAWIQQMQSNRDGYFYHPHWGVSINSSRRSRDYGNSSTAFSASGSLAYRLYSDANYRLSGGKSGTKGVLEPSAYDGALTAVLGYSMAEAVSRLVLASDSSMPAHFASETAFVHYLNSIWNQTCKVAGVHERHVCSDSCNIAVSDTGSYMTISDGKLAVTRGYECTSHHECAHTVGHSYSYGHTVTSQGSQIKAAGLSEAVVAYFYDIQENVQASLRDKADAVYMTKTGFEIYRAMTDAERARVNYGEEAWLALSDSDRREAVKYVYVLESAYDSYDALSKTEADEIDFNIYLLEKGISAWSKLSADGRASVLGDYERTEMAKKLVYLGAPVWEALDEPERAAVIESSENGIWEEEITYNTVSGLLKICGIPGTHGKEFLYAEEAIGTAVKVALFSVDDFVAKGEAIVSIYNPFNAISGIISNVDNYGSDPAVVDRTYAKVRARAKELIENTAAKVACYLMPDGGYSYNMGGYCVNSQGQPVAVNGYVPSDRLPNELGIVESGEGDVNGTALALGTRSALLRSLGLSVGAPFSGNNALYSEDGYDLDGDGTISREELTATHTDVFRSLITGKSPIVKVDNSEIGGFTYSFEDGVGVANGEIISEPDNTENKVLCAVDSEGAKGISALFTPSFDIGEVNTTVFEFDMRIAESYTVGVTHQIFVNGGAVLVVNMNFGTNGYFDSFTNSADGEVLCDESGDKIVVNGKEWFTIRLEIFDAPVLVNGQEKRVEITVTQNGAGYVGYFSNLRSDNDITNASVYSLNAARNTFYLDNVSLVSYCASGAENGYYHFDTEIQKKVFEDEAAPSPVDDNDTVCELSSGVTELDAYYYSTSSVIYNFNSLVADIILSDMKVGEKIAVDFTDSLGRRITGVYLVMNPDGSVSFYSINGAILDGTMRLSGIVIQSDMTLNIDTSKPVTLKLEYHHDMQEPRLDIVVKYADAENNGYYAVSAASLTGVTSYDYGAVASDFTAMRFKYESLGGKAYVDDLFIRNVVVP